MILYNGISHPALIQGLPLLGNEPKQSFKHFKRIMETAVKNGIRAFDTSHAYGKSEHYIGKALRQLARENIIAREEVYITTKIDNNQQYQGQIDCCIDEALQRLETDYIDLLLLHWPVPGCYIKNWGSLEKAYDARKVKAIGLANCRERHLIALMNAPIRIKPHAVQFEFHPFRTVSRLVTFCKEQHIAIQAYSSLCKMIPMVKENKILNSLVAKYNKSISQIILRWDIQQDIAPIFQSYNLNRIQENADVFDFIIEDGDMREISTLDIDYKFHPESMNCPGY